MKNSLLNLIIFFMMVVVTFTMEIPVDNSDSDSDAAETESGIDSIIIDEDFNGNFLQQEGGDLLILEWIPSPINKYRYIIVSSLELIPIERGVTNLSTFTKEAYPNLTLALACVPGDGDYIYFEHMDMISVDAFRNDHYFQEYQDIIFTIHGFQYKVELWAYFIQFQEQFWPVRDRLSSVFEEYLESKEVDNPKPFQGDRKWSRSR